MKLLYNTYPKGITFLLIVFVVISVLGMGCKKFVTVDPPVNSLIGSTIFADDATATAAVVGIYSRMMEQQPQSMGSGNQSLGMATGVASDEQDNYSVLPTLIEFAQNNLNSRNSFVFRFWTEPYTYIYSSNAILEGLEKSTKVSDGVKKQVAGEARFIRAFMHFYLVNLYGDIPYVTTTDYVVNQTVTRRPVSEVYDKIIADLIIAQNFLPNSYTNYGNERTRASRMAATALLARVYLYNGNWQKAETEASALISNSALFSLPALSQVFLKNSREAIWQLQPVLPGLSSGEAFAYIFPTRPVRTALTSSFVNSFQTGDARKTAWVGSKVSAGVTNYHPNKYKERTVASGATPTEYLMVLRLAEQYLIRAEAKAMQDKIIEGKSDLDAVRMRAGLGGTTATDKASLLNAIEHERRVELFTEWGHRWLDLKRTNRIDAVLGAYKGASWQPTDKLFPIPQAELDRNPYLRPQNPGY